MIVLNDSINISVPLDSLYDWLYELDKNFSKWSPYHDYFEKISGKWDVGDKIKFKEIVMGVPYEVTGTITKHEKKDDAFTIAFSSMSGLGNIYFEGNATDSGCKFTHIEEFGKPNTLWGKLVNWLLFDVLFKNKANWELILNDMKEDNLYLKQILETGVYPEIEG